MPDNGDFDQEVVEANIREAAAYKSPWTVGKLLKKKQVWFVTVGFGLYVMVTVAMISQLIPRLMAGGWSQNYATTMMAAASVWGMVGSYATGWFDQKIGTKVTSIIVGVIYLAACIMCCLPPNNITLYLSLFFLGIGIGSIGNLFPSMLSNMVNRYDFALLLGIGNVFTLILRSFTFGILAFGMENLGGFAGAFSIMAVLNLVAIVLIVLAKDEELKP